MTRIKACDPDDMALDSVIQISTSDGLNIALYRIEAGYFATDDLCSHGAAFLSEGDIEGEDIVCPFHGGTFDIQTGDATGAPCMSPVRSHPVVVEADGIYIEVSDT